MESQREGLPTITTHLNEPEQPSGEPQPRIQIEQSFEDTWPGASALATACVANLGLLNEQMAAFGEALVQRYRIPSRAAFNVLTILAGAGEPLPPSVIAERMIVTRPTMTGILTSLERRGLIWRRPHATDRRMVLIELTPSGRERVDQVRPALHQAERRWMTALGETDQRALLRAVAKLQANALHAG